jgi:hydrogenase maturation protease
MARCEVLIIGIGNADRGDDAVGRVVAERLAADPLGGARVVETDGEVARLLSLLEADAVVIVDAASSNDPAGTVHRFDAAGAAIPAAMFSMSTHAMGLAECLELARALGRMPARCVVYAVSAARFDIGTPLSAEVAAVVDHVAARIREEAGAEVV